MDIENQVDKLGYDYTMYRLSSIWKQTLVWNICSKSEIRNVFLNVTERNEKRLRKP